MYTSTVVAELAYVGEGELKSGELLLVVTSRSEDSESTICKVGGVG